jgi:hypothetical protein
MKHLRAGSGGQDAAGKTPPRRYPRQDLKLKVHLTFADGKKQLDAVVSSANISVGGVFFESTFFLKLGQQLWVEFELPRDGRKVRAKGTVVRHERIDERRRSKSGFAVRFTEFADGSDVVLATHFLAPQLREFVVGYLRRRAHDKRELGEQMVDLLSAWELRKVEAGSAIWGKTP